MSYPQDPGYQAGSETSEAAAINLIGKDRQEGIILSWMERKGEFGMTIDEASVLLSEVLERQIHRHCVGPSARPGAGWQDQQDPKKRKTRTGSAANVYIIGTWSETLLAKAPPVISKPEEPPETVLQRLQRYEAQLSIHGHGRTVPFTAIIQRTVERCHADAGL